MSLFPRVYFGFVACAAIGRLPGNRLSVGPVQTPAPPNTPSAPAAPQNAARRTAMAAPVQANALNREQWSQLGVNSTPFDDYQFEAIREAEVSAAPAARPAVHVRTPLPLFRPSAQHLTSETARGAPTGSPCRELRNTRRT